MYLKTNSNPPKAKYLHLIANTKKVIFKHELWFYKRIRFCLHCFAWSIDRFIGCAIFKNFYILNFTLDTSGVHLYRFCENLFFSNLWLPIAIRTHYRLPNYFFVRLLEITTVAKKRPRKPK